MSKPKSVGAYIRVSTEDQAEHGLSIANQKSRLTAYCQAQRWEIYDFYVDDGFSGKDLKRPAMERLIDDVQNGLVTTVLVLKLDRLSRRQKDILYLLEDVFEPIDVNFVSVTENFETSTPFGKAMLSMMGVFAQLERDTIIQRSKWGKLEAAKEGRWHGGTIYGYGYEPGTYTLKVRESEAAIVRQIFDLYMDNGTRKISYILNDRGVPSPRGGSWKDATILYLITNPIYVGKIRHLGKLYDAQHDPIIDTDTWDKVQKEYKRRSFKKVRRYSEGLLSGLIFCGECGSRMRIKNEWINRPSKPKKIRPYYICYSQDKVKHMAKAEDCRCGYKKADEVKERVIDQLYKLSIDENLIEEELHKQMAKSKDKNLELKKRISRAKSEMKQVTASLDRWYEAFEKGALDPDELTDRVRDLREKRIRLEEHLQKLQKRVALEKERNVNKKQLVEMVKNFKVIWKHATDEEQKKIINGLVKGVYLHQNDAVEVKLNFK